MSHVLHLLLIFLDRESGHDAWHNEQAVDPCEEDAPEQSSLYSTLVEEPWPLFSDEEEADEPADPMETEPADPTETESIDQMESDANRIHSVLNEVEYVQQLQYIPPRRQSGAL